eukprot:g4421.t1
MFYSILFFVLLLTANFSTLANAKACESAPKVQPNNKVNQGASPAPKCRYQYLVSLRHHLWGTHTCSGTLINPRCVLTAASCASLLGNGGKARINGFYREGPFEQTINILEYIKHPKYESGELANDVAILKLAEPFSGEDTVTIAISSKTPTKGKPVALVGWGRLESQGAYSDVMQVNDDLKITPNACTGARANGVICAGNPNSYLCEGDFGGPLIVKGRGGNRDTQVGIISNAVAACVTSKGSGRFTEVAAVASWIEENTQ